MGLPVVPLPRDTVNVAGQDVEVRGLSRAEALRLRSLIEDEDAADAFVLQCGTGVSHDEAAAWREVTPLETVGLLVDRILELSALTGEASKSDGAGPSAGGA